MEDNVILSLITHPIRLEQKLSSHQIVNPVSPVSDQLKEIAVGWVCDEIGKNNYVDTFDENKPISNFPAGTYVLRFEGSAKTKINVYYITSGRLVGVNVNPIGYFIVMSTPSYMSKEREMYQQTILGLQGQLKDKDHLLHQVGIKAKQAVEKIMKEFEENNEKIKTLETENGRLIHLWDQDIERLEQIEEEVRLLRETQQMRDSNAVESPTTRPLIHSVTRPSTQTPVMDGIISSIKNFDVTTLKKSGTTRDMLEQKQKKDEDEEDVKPPPWMVTLKPVE